MKAKITLIGTLFLPLLIGCSGGGEPTPRPNNPTPVVENVDPEENAMQNKGVGPVKSVSLEAIDAVLSDEGKAIFDAKCTACHKIDQKYIGPAIAGVTERRTPEWIMNMILNPTEMIAQDPLAKKLVGDSNGAIMANQSLTEDEARAVLEYFRTL